jgi:dTMP kinase
MRGKLIVFEGIDRSGKSTQAKRLAAALPNSLFMSFPNRTTQIASMIDAYLKSSLNLDDYSVHLLFSANRWECRSQILNAIHNGQDVVLDRYSFSGIAYSAAKGLDLNWCLCPEKGLPKPDVIFFIRISPQVAKERAEYGGERYERIEFQEKVAEKYDEVMKNMENCVVVDGLLSQDEVFQLVIERISHVNTDVPLGSL